MVGVADLATGFKLPAPPPDTSRFGKTRSDLFRESKRAARSKGEVWLQYPSKTKKHHDKVSAVMKKVKMNSKVDTRCLKASYEKAVAMAHVPVKKPFLRAKHQSHAHATKPNLVASTVGFGNYDPSLQSKCYLNSIWISPDQPSGLDSYNVPLFSSFSSNKIFSCKFSKQKATAKCTDDLEDGVLQCFAYVRDSKGKWRCQKKRPNTCRGSTTSEWLSEVQRPKTEEFEMRATSSSGLPPQPPAARRPSSCGTKRTLSAGVIPTPPARRLSASSTSLLESTPGHYPTSVPTDTQMSSSSHWLTRPQSE